MIRNKRLDDQEFWRERQEVLAEWPTGKEVDLDEAIEYHKSLLPAKNWAMRAREAKQKGETLVNLMGMGNATIEQQMELITYAQREGNADLLGTTVDSFTRLHDFKAAERGIKESQRTGKTVLNGFPIVNYGVCATRKLVEAVRVPMTMKFAALDPRIITEVALAAGHSSCEGSGALLPFLNHNSKAPLERVIRNFQYIYRLLGYYEEKGCPMSVGSYCGLAGMTPPSLSSAEEIIESLAMAEQGIKNITFQYGALGNLVQDVASARVCTGILREYLDRFGYKDVELDLSFHNASYTRMPDDPARSFAVLSQHALAAVLSGAQFCNSRGITEGKFIAGKEALADTFKCIKTIIDIFKTQKIELDSKALEVEADMFKREVRAITDAVIELGDGDVVIGMIKAIPAGIIDHPFGTHPSILCKVMGVRDAEGAVRWYDHGNIPFSKEIIEFNKEKIAERERKRGKEIDFDTLVDDIIALGDGTLLPV